MFISSPSRYRHEKKGRQRNNFVIVDENNTDTDAPLSLDGSAASAAESQAPTISQQKSQATLCWSGPLSESKRRVKNYF